VLVYRAAGVLEDEPACLRQAFVTMLKTVLAPARGMISALGMSVAYRRCGTCPERRPDSGFGGHSHGRDGGVHDLYQRP
jgi:hypothetical protein